MAKDNLYNAWRKATATVGFPSLLLHDCRRTTVRNLVRAGVPDKVAQAISGHKTRSVFDRYNIVDENDLRDATAKLKRSLGTIWAQNGDFGGAGNEDFSSDSVGTKAVTH